MTVTSITNKIGRNDLAYWDGASSFEFTRKTSAGGLLTCYKIGNAIDALSVFGSNTAYTLATISAACSAPSGYATVELSPGTWVIDSDYTIPSDINLVIHRGASLQIATGVTLTINGDIDTGLWKVFDCQGSGKVILNSNTVGLYPEWWGAVGDGVTDDTSAFEDAIDAKGKYGVIQLGQNKKYLLGSLDPINYGLCIQGAGDGSSMLLFDTIGDCIYIEPNTDYYSTKVVLKNFRIHTTNNIPTNLIVLGSSTATDPQVFDATIQNVSCGYDSVSDTYPYSTGAFIFSQSTSYLLIDRCRVDQAYLGYGIRTQHSQNTTPATIACSIRQTKISNLIDTGGYTAVGLRVDGCQGLWVYGSSIQACRGGGIHLNAADGQLIQNFAMYGGHIEENVGWDIKYSGHDSTYRVYPSSFNSVQFFNTAGSVIDDDGWSLEKRCTHCFFNNGISSTGSGKINLTFDRCTGSITTDNGYTQPVLNRNGDTAGRPTLTADDIGFTYWDTDEAKLIVWNGSAWKNCDGTAL